MGLRGPWPGPAGMIPEPPMNPGDANMITRRYLDGILLEERIIDAEEADISMDLFGSQFASPIMMPAFSHLDKALNEKNRAPMEEYAEAARRMHLVNWVGMESDEDFQTIATINPKTVRIIKPFADPDMIFKQIDVAASVGALAVGIDIDHVFGTDGLYDVVDGIPMGAIYSDELAGYVKYAKERRLPFVAKGVLSLDDAQKCAEAGCEAIMLSHHHGRMPFAVPPLMVLPEIRRELDVYAMENSKPMVHIFVDCGINDGYDAYKALAMGADAVAVGRGMLPALLKDGTEGVMKKVERMNQELMQAMGYTGVRMLDDMDPSVLWVDGRRPVL